MNKAKISAQSPADTPPLNENLLKELKKLSLMRAAERRHWKEIARELKENGADDITANTLARQAVALPKWFGADWRSAGIGLSILIGGGISLLAILVWWNEGGSIPIILFVLAPSLTVVGLVTFLASLKRH